MILPNPCHVTVTWISNDDPSGQDDKNVWEFFAVYPRMDGKWLVWQNEQDEYSRLMGSEEFVQDGLSWVNTTSQGAEIRIREIDPYDAVILAPGAGVPQPVEAIKNALLGGMMGTELDAVVAADNTVATLMLETDVGIYLRYSRSWLLLGPDSTQLEDMQIVPVAAGALDVWDAGDAANRQVSVFDLPVSTGTSADGLDKIWIPGKKEPAVAVEELALPMLATGVSIPDVEDEDDLAGAIKFAASHPAARWFVEKRAAALGAGKLPWS